MKWRTYPAYRDSGVEWLGEIPEHWETKHLKYTFLILNGSTPKSNEQDYWDGDIPWATPDDLGSLNNDTLNTTHRMITQEGYDSCGTSLAPAGSLILSTRAPIGHLALAGTSLCTNQGCRSLVFRADAEKRFYYYQLLTAKQELGSWGQGSTFRELSRDKLGSIFLATPSFREQRVIVSFLDRETSRIDDLIGKKQRQIEILQEKRSALISHVVTKGLDPDVKMKDSGVEWLREIPEHWAIHSIKRVSTRIQTGCTPPTAEERYYELGTIPWYGPGSFGTNLILSEPTKLLNEDSVREGAARIFAEDSVMVVTIGATIGKVGYLASPASSNQQITAISPNQNEVSGKFLAYQLKRLEPVLRGIAPSTTLPIMDQQELGSLPCALPGLDEQKRIVQHIDLQSQKIDRMIETIRNSIDLLREYRTALISAAVTGKIDVREEVA